jgi:hypothetical protein
MIVAGSTSVENPAPRLRIGDHLVSARRFISHQGIYAGKGQVIHYGGLANGLQAGPVKISRLKDFLADHPYSVSEYKTRTYSREESLERARARIGEDLYHPVLNNCEHFVTWCITGKTRSTQVDLLFGLTEALGVCFSAARGPCCTGCTGGYAPSSRDRGIGRGCFADDQTIVVSSRGFLRAQNEAILGSQ